MPPSSRRSRPTDVACSGDAPVNSTRPSAAARLPKLLKGVSMGASCRLAVSSTASCDTALRPTQHTSCRAEAKA